MNKFIAAIAALIVLLVAIAALLPNLISPESYKGKIEEEASKALGRSVTFGDDISFKIIPRTAFSVSDLEIANAEGFEGDYLARVKNADIGVSLLPLLTGGAVNIEKFILVEPDLNFQKNANGDANWTFTDAASGDTSTSDDNDAGQASGATGIQPDVTLGDVRISDGRAIFKDAAENKTYTTENIDVTVKLHSLKEPLEIDGSMTFQGAPATVDLVLTTLADLRDKKSANLKLDARLGEAKIGADLTFAEGEAFSYSGPVSVDAPNLPALAALFDIALEEAPGFDRLSAKGAASGSDEKISLSGATIQFDEIDATGDLAIAWSGAKPKASGALNVGKLDLRPYMPAPAETSAGFPAWSKDELDFSSLKNIDADLSLRANEIFLNGMTFGESQMQVIIDNARLTADVPRLTIYEGGGSGRLVVNARSRVPSFSGNLNTTSVQAEPMAKDILKNDRLIGVGGFRFDFTASGASQDAIMSSLDGNGGFDLNDGALKGVNLANLASSISSLQEGGLTNPAAIAEAISTARSPAEQTEFSKFLSQFVINDGVATVPTISLEGPFLTMTGNGTVNIAKQTIDLRLSPKATTTADGQNGKSYAIPVKVGGTFSKPSIGVDLESVVRDRAEDAVRGALSGVLGGDDEDGESSTAKSVLKGILGGDKDNSSDDAADGATTDQSTEDTVKSIASDAIGGLFGSRNKNDEADDSEDGSD